MSLPRVMIGGPIRDREWSVSLWLGGLLGLDYPKHLLSLVILVNDSTDGTLPACQWWAERALDEGYARAEVIVHNRGTVVDNNARRGNRDYLAYAVLRDMWVAQRRDEEWLFSVDSDIQVPRHMLQGLAGFAQRDGYALLAGVIENNWAPAVEHATNVLVSDGEGQAHHSKHAFIGRELEPRPCVLTGACCVINPVVFDAGISYTDPTKPGVPEDNIFCQRLLQAGLKIGYVPGLRATHWHRPPVDTDWMQQPDWWERQAAYAQFRGAQPAMLREVTA